MMLSATKFAELAVSPRSAYHLAKKLYAIRKSAPEVSSTPGFDEGGARYFSEIVKTAFFMIEYGSGGSTLQASAEGVDVLSVDTDERYVNAVNDRLRANGNTSSQVLYSSIGLTVEWGVPIDTVPTEQNMGLWDAYVSRPWTSPERSGKWPDIVLVDGRFRVACVAEAGLRSLREGLPARILMDDFAERPEYWAVTRLFDVRDFGSRMVELLLKPTCRAESLQDLRRVYQRDFR